MVPSAHQKAKSSSTKHWNKPAPGDFTITWREIDGPPVIPPSRTGFGSRMIERMLAAELGGGVSMSYDPAGVTCVIEGGPSARVDWREPGSSQEEVTEGQPSRRGSDPTP